MSGNQPSHKERLMFFIAGVLLLVISLAIVLSLTHKREVYLRNEISSRTAAAKAGKEVSVVRSGLSSGERTVSLVGEARPYAEVTLYAKVSGYLKEIRVDKGDRVRAGQVLAVIESPELNRQYEAARTDAQDKRRDADRAKTLVAKGYISQQDADHAEAAARESEANAEALRVQKDYEILSAPFSGIVTARFADPGALLQSAVSAQTSALPVVNVSKTDKLRVYVYLDQKDAIFVHAGDAAEIFDAARPDVKLQASVTRMSGQLDQNTRTLLAELDVDNRRGAILAGSFVQVSLKLKTSPLVEVPADALLIRGDKTYVAVVVPGNKVKIQSVNISDSDGKTARLSSGLDNGAVIILNPVAELFDGEQVQPVTKGSSNK